jgi:hypothetical protein
MIAKINIYEPKHFDDNLTLCAAMGKKKVGALEKVDADLFVLLPPSRILELH